MVYFLHQPRLILLLTTLSMKANSEHYGISWLHIISSLVLINSTTLSPYADKLIVSLLLNYLRIDVNLLLIWYDRLNIQFHFG